MLNGASNGDASLHTETLNMSANKMREKLQALEDLNELLEEPVEEQVRPNKKSSNWSNVAL
jgi:hypothetical protein